MKVLLRETLEKLGERGEIVDVKPGYARNYLLPRHLAVPATEDNFKQLEVERARIGKRIVKERQEREALREKLETVSCTITMSASPEGHLYGSVGPQEIAECLVKEGFDVSEQHIKLEEHFKETGVFVVEVALAADLVANVRVWIVPEST